MPFGFLSEQAFSFAIRAPIPCQPFNLGIQLGGAERQRVRRESGDCHEWPGRNGLQLQDEQGNPDQSGRSTRAAGRSVWPRKQAGHGSFHPEALRQLRIRHRGRALMRPRGGAAFKSRLFEGQFQGGRSGPPRPRPGPPLGAKPPHRQCPVLAGSPAVGGFKLEHWEIENSPEADQIVGIVSSGSTQPTRGMTAAKGPDWRAARSRKRAKTKPKQGQTKPKQSQSKAKKARVRDRG